MLNMQPAGSVLSVMEFNLCVGLLFYFALLFCVSFNVVCVFILLEFLMNKDVYTVYIFWQETSIVRVLIFVRLATWYDSSSDGDSTWYEQSRYPIIAPLALHNEQIEAQLGERGGGEACFCRCNQSYRCKYIWLHVAARHDLCTCRSVAWLFCC